jgi:putative endonuclease
MPFVYLVRCSDQSLYVGHTRNLASREQAHIEGYGAAYTAKRRPVRMVYAEEYPSELEALRRERQIKGWTSRKKEALIAGDDASLKRLSKRCRYAGELFLGPGHPEPEATVPAPWKFESFLPHQLPKGPDCRAFFHSFANGSATSADRLMGAASSATTKVTRQRPFAIACTESDEASGLSRRLFLRAARQGLQSQRSPQ